MWGSESLVRDLGALAVLSEDALRTSFRRVLADLAAQLSHRPLPLEGVDPSELLAFVQKAMSEQLFDDLAWLSPVNGASALYELMCALPASSERDYLEQLVEQRLALADAPTFVALSTLLVQGSRTGLSTPSMRARVSLALSLPMGSVANVDALALALISRPEFAREWVEKPSQGSLPSRRLAARLLERAAREAARRFLLRDDAGLRALESAPVKSAWGRLLADRESLVWRHVAIARGLLAASVPELWEELATGLDPNLSPTEWRRAATSLAASLAVAQGRARELAESFLRSEVPRRDPGVAACMIMGLLPAAELAPDAAEELLGPLLKLGGILAAEAFVELRYEVESFGADALSHVRVWLEAQKSDPDALADDGAFALIEWLLERLSGDASLPSLPLERMVQRALMGFDQQGTLAAVALAKDALSRAEYAVSWLLQADSDTRAGRIEMTRGLIEIDQGLLQTSTLFDLCVLVDHEGSRGRLERLFEQLSEWFLKHEQVPVESAAVAHPALRIRRVRALLHMVDAEGSHGDGLAAARRPRRLRVTRSLLNRVRRETSSVLSRAVMACLARAFDALVREEVFELSDVVLCASLYVRNPDYIATLAEASMVPELHRALLALAQLVRHGQSSGEATGTRGESLDALAQLARALPAAHAARVSALRWAVTRLHVALRVFESARSLERVVTPEKSGQAFLSLSDALLTLAQLIAGARRRLNPSARVRPPSVNLCIGMLRSTCEDLVAGSRSDALDVPLSDLDEALSAELSPPFHAPCLRVLSTLKTLPLHVHGQTPSLAQGSLPTSAVQKLPAWLPTTRLLGGFYVVSPLGEGAGGSVFMARRAEQRGDEHAEVFALKVPEYNGDVAHLLSEADFLKMFREEAGALLALPEEPHLARFVTFDAGVKPKPILVMEHVEGPSLEKLLARRHLDVAQAFSVLAGIVDGLEAMHQSGIAHLDVKPSNVIVRGFWSGVLTPVLVDFGLSGRRLRPGCGTPNYAAPEIWGSHGEDGVPDPRAADVYALGCLAYELLTGEALFGARADVALVAAHLSHDGAPPPIQEMHRDLALRGLAEWISHCLRQRPQARQRVSELKRQLPFLDADLRERGWPLAPHTHGARAQRAVVSR